jgi:hypothetical protein
MPNPGTWTKPSPDLVARFDAAVPEHPALERRQMFGYPACFVNGHYLAGLHAEDVVIRLPPEIAGRFPEMAGASTFDPMGTGAGMKNWYRVPDEIVGDVRRLSGLLATAADALAELPAKPPKARRPAKTRRPAD